MTDTPSAVRSLSGIKWLTFFMFMMFAMTTDSVGVIIPEVIKEFLFSMTVGGLSTMLRCQALRSQLSFLVIWRTSWDGREPSFWAWFFLR